jgi:HEAT repeat protein
VTRLKKDLKLILAAAILLPAAVAAADEAQLIAVLKSEASLKEKADACRELAHVATKNAVPALAAMLGDEKLSHMARYALEPIPDPSVDEALRDALGKVKGRPLVGVIGSLGVRRDAKAVPALAKLLADADADVAQAAARALGSIGTSDAAKALEGALPNAPDAHRVAFCEGLFRCAEALAAGGNAAKAQAVYDGLRALPQAPQQVRVGALRGAVLLRGKQGIPLLVEALRSADYVLFAAAARVSMEMPGAEVTAALAGELPKLPPDRQILVIKTLGHRGDASAGPALAPLAAQGPDAVRLAAIRNLTHLGYAPALPMLAELSLSGEGELASVARECLGGFPGQDADATIAAMLSHKDAKVRSLAVEMIGQRKAGKAAAHLLKAAADEEESVRLAALRALRDQAGQADLPALLAILVKARSAAEMQAAENALGALVARQSGPAQGQVVILKALYGDLPAGTSADVTAKVAAMVKDGSMAIEASNGNFGDPVPNIVKKLRVDYSVNGVVVSKTVAENESLALTAISTPPAIVEAICASMAGAPSEAKCALLRTLRSAGGPKALETVQAAMSESDARVKDAAMRALCDWPTPDALPAVGRLLGSPPNRTIKVLALRGFVRLVPQESAPDAKKLKSLQEAMSLADRDEEKRLVLSALGNIPTAEALALVVAQLDSATLREEACSAAVAIAEKIGAGHAPEVVAAMTRVAKTTADKKLAARAEAIARNAKK